MPQISTVSVPITRSAGAFSRVKKVSPTSSIKNDPPFTCGYWNHLKGGVDILSRIMKTLARKNISENPVLSIIARLLILKVINDGVIFRLSQAEKLIFLQ